MAEQKYFLTKEGLNKVQHEYQKLKEVKKEKTLEETPQALHSEELDTEFVAYREDMEFLEARIEELEYVLKYAELIAIPDEAKRQQVTLGAKVRLVVNGQEDEFIIVGTYEADPNLGRISNDSPVGKALLGHKVGDEVEVSSPKKTIYKIKKVEYKEI